MAIKSRKKLRFKITNLDNDLVKLVGETDHKVLAVWSKDCVERVFHYFAEMYPEDNRPREALTTLQRWIDTGIFSMSVIRRASLASHAAAREVGEDNAARSVARAAGQAVATAHVPRHSLGGSIYALQAIHRASDASDADEKVAAELKWQTEHLEKLRNQA